MSFQTGGQGQGGQDCPGGQDGLGGSGGLDGPGGQTGTGVLSGQAGQGGQEVNFWSIKRVYFFKNANVLNF